MTAEAITQKTFLFPNHHEAVAVFPAAATSAQDIRQALQLSPYHAVLMVVGGAGNIDERLAPRLTQMFGRAITRAAAEADAIILDGGTQAGIMAMMGEGVAGRGYTTRQIGVAPLGKICLPGQSGAGTPLEPNHSHFVLVEGNDWGSETASLFQLAGELIQHAPVSTDTNGVFNEQPAQVVTGTVPALVILAGGGAHTKNEMLRAVRQNLSILIMEGSGGLADEIAEAAKTDKTQPTDDPVMAEIIADGRLQYYHLTRSVKGLELLIIRELGKDNVLMQAWETFADYDLNANHQQQRFNWLQLSIIVIGVVGTGLAIYQQMVAPKYPGTVDLYSLTDLWSAPNRIEVSGWIMLRQLLIVIPILLTVLVTATNRFKQGSKWLLLRAGAESIKREIYRYRTRAMYYKENADLQLAQKVEDITRRTMRTEVNSTSLLPYDKEKGFPPYMFAANGGDDGFTRLTPDRYVEVRLGDQLSYFKKKAVILERDLKALYWLTFVFGGIGTYLAAVDQQVWIALTTAIVAAMGTYMGFRQIDNTLTKYNQAATDLSNVKAWWNALTSDKKALPENIDTLVTHTEQVLQTELDGWVQQMQNALAELHKNQAQVTEREEKKEPEEKIIPKESGEEGNADADKEKKPVQPADATKDVATPPILVTGNADDPKTVVQEEIQPDAPTVAAPDAPAGNAITQSLQAEDDAIELAGREEADEPPGDSEDIPAEDKKSP